MKTAGMIALALPLALAMATTLACSASPSPLPDKVAEQKATDAAPEAAAKTGTPKISSKQPEHDFGPISLGDRVEHVFKIQNVGDGDLKIERVQRT